MKNDIFEFFQLERQIFGVCPKCHNFFRLSDCKIFPKEKKGLDWLDELHKQKEKIEKAEDRLYEKEYELRRKAREKGRKQALKVARKIDRVFTPRGLNPDDAKVLFHPIDYVVFNGMNDKDSKMIRDIVLLDREHRDVPSRRLQRSIEKTIESGNYEWRTIVVDYHGEIKCK